ncbi:MAG: energy transducer TonB [Sphingobacteriales bacterium]|nr:energy transducer TonB [Sphingobacteriales bacterium]
MNKELIMKTDVLDILFENRNKNYGAYDLRKHYNNRLTRSLLIMLGGALVLSAFSLIPSKEMISVSPGIITDPSLGHIQPPKQPDPVKIEVKPVQPKTSTTKFPSRIVFTNHIDSADNLNRDLSRTSIGGTNVVVTSIGDPYTGGTGGGGTIDVVRPNPDPVVPDRSPVETAEIMPSFPGGMAALRKFLERNLQTPNDMEPGEEVEVKVKFVVGYDGKLQSFLTVKDGGPAYTNEVLRVLRKMPDWIPGKSNGENVAVYYTIPVKFIPAE